MENGLNMDSLDERIRLWTQGGQGRISGGFSTTLVDDLIADHQRLTAEVERLEKLEVWYVMRCKEYQLAVEREAK